jgi:hypothetical protein
MYVEIHDLRVRRAFSKGIDGDGDRVGWLADPTRPLGPFTEVHGEISEAFVTTRHAPQQPPDNALIDVPGFVYWDPQHVAKQWHEYTGGELLPLTAWRSAP